MEYCIDKSLQKFQKELKYLNISDFLDALYTDIRRIYERYV